MPRKVISLTTIPPRFDKIGSTLRDLLNQTARFDEIRLNISRQYRRFPGELPSLPTLPDGVTLHLCDQDFGPATKVLPTILDPQNAEAEILFCDDDQPYEPTWAQSFLDARKIHSGACIVGKGYDLNTRPIGHRYELHYTNLPRAEKRRKNLSYRLFRLFTAFTVKPNSYVKDGFVDILEGYRGALVRPDFFPKETFDIPDVLWTVDDPWLSGQLTRNNVPIWMLSTQKSHARPYEAHFSDRLGKFVYKDHGRLKADRACIDYFRDTYGIWQGFRETPETAPTKHIAYFFGRKVPFLSSPATDQIV